MSAGLFSGDIFFRVRSRHDQKVTQLELLTLQVKPFWLRKTSMGFPWVFGGDHVSEEKHGNPSTKNIGGTEMFMAKIQVSSDQNPGYLLQEKDDTS